MSETKPTNGFTKEEWDACIKVLSVLKDNPFENPDNQLFAGLITKIHQQAKKTNRKESSSAKKAGDLKTMLDSAIAKNAVGGKTLFGSHQSAEHSFTPLSIPKNCYCCNSSYTQAHFFYNRLCKNCAIENYSKRFQEINLEGRNVILTGGRVKVGFATALRFLRNKANLVITTRFPALALQQFQQEDDYNLWKDRLTIYGLDLRNLKAIEAFVAFYTSQYNTLDILINNAAQTIKYTDEYYSPLIKNEQQLLIANNNEPRLFANTTAISNQVKNLEYNQGEITDLKLNRFGQPVDEREKTSWNSTLAEISVYELVEVNLINHIAPYFLIKELKPLMQQSGFDDKFIINVTSSEGIFSYANKTMFHPHTNMTKAALNMLTLTSAKEFVEDRIYMTSVDVGWISTGAVERLRKAQFEKGYIPPLDAVDGASRILDPVAATINGNKLYGVLLKNYKVAPW